MGISNIHDALEGEERDRDEDDAELQVLRHFRNVIANIDINNEIGKDPLLTLAICVSAARKLKRKWEATDA